MLILSVKEMMSNIITIASVLVTAFLGCITIYQNTKMNEINDRLLGIEEAKAVPSLGIEENRCIFEEYGERCIWLKLFIKNLSEGVVEIISVDNTSIHVAQSDNTHILEFNKNEFEFPTLLPGQSKQLDFSYESKDEKLISRDSLIYKEQGKNGRTVVCNTTIKYRYKESNTEYLEKVQVCFNISWLYVVEIQVNKENIKVTRTDYRIDKQ